MCLDARLWGGDLTEEAFPAIFLHLSGFFLWEFLKMIYLFNVFSVWVCSTVWTQLARPLSTNNNSLKGYKKEMGLSWKCLEQKAVSTAW